MVRLGFKIKGSDSQGRVPDSSRFYSSNRVVSKHRQWMPMWGDEVREISIEGILAVKQEWKKKIVGVGNKIKQKF